VELLNLLFPFQEVRELHPETALPSRFTAQHVLDLLHQGRDPGGREGSFWVLDPIDGTKGFIRDAQYAIGLGFVRSGAPIIGSIACPNLAAHGGNVEQRADGAGFVFFASRSRSSVLGIERLEEVVSGKRRLTVDWHGLGTNLNVAQLEPTQAAVLCESYEAP